MGGGGGDGGDKWWREKIPNKPGQADGGVGCLFCLWRCFVCVEKLNQLMSVYILCVQNNNNNNDKEVVWREVAALSSVFRCCVLAVNAIAG